MTAGEGKVHNPDSFTITRKLVDDEGFCEATYEGENLVAVDLRDGHGVYHTTSYDAVEDSWVLQR